ncbi:MAG: VWA domain-containing protein [Elusimicrobiota bacterium]
MFRFAYSYILFLLVIVPVLAWFNRNKGAGNSYIKYSDISNLKSVFKDKKPKYYSNILLAIRLLAIALLIFTAARPQSGSKSEEVITKGYDIMLCLDTSSSMKAEDFKPNNRLFAAKEVVKEFIRGRKHDRIGLVVFAGVSFTQCPLTVDYNSLLDFLNNVEIGITQTDGTAIGTALITCANRLKDSSGKSKIIILLTDGRNNMGEIDPVTAAKACEALGIRIYTIGAGVPGGALYPIDDPIFGKRYVKIEEDLDEGALQKIALATDGRYFRATGEESLKSIYKQIDAMEKSEIRVKEYTNYTELFRFFLFPALLLLLLELILKYFIWKRIP